ncbi:sugar ABC transporter permease [Cellulomonas sp. DKR-3]|uniref:Sugar ABC transporter permease n=1 Tax=Cellulomonas fulva TaxID=2835530 RepID=A0ABS5TV13_9CELL|nr:sugar ABC transporter permease [Cellulomonas fulva]MBT0992989.1 sugar ABC transporter permease [Cellulomonas fulva]
MASAQLAVAVPGRERTSAAPAGSRKGRRRRRWIGLVYLAPGLALYTWIVLVPLGQSFVYSLYQWDGVSAPVPVGVDNYTAFFSDPELVAALRHVVVLVFFFALLPIALGLTSAAILSRRRLRGQSAYRWVLFLPQVITSVVIAVVWKRILAPAGPLNEALRAVGLDSMAKSWLGDTAWALPSLGLIGAWVTFGFCMVLFIAGAQSIPTELYEAARVDGAGPAREFFSIMLPALRPQLAVALTLTVTAALRTFDLVWLTTQGGPGSSTLTPAVLLYRRAFQNPDVGAAAAIGVVMAVFCLVVAVLIQRISERGETP